MNSQAIIRHLHDCCQADSHQQAIWNLLGSKVDHLHALIRIDPVLEGALDTVGVGDGEWLDAASRSIATYRREKTLIVGLFPVVGSGRWGQPPRTEICAPLVFCEAELEHDRERGAGLLRVKMETMRPNSTVIAALCHEELPKEQVDALLDKITQSMGTAADIYGLAYDLEKAMDGVNWDALKAYPKLSPLEDLRKAQKKVGARCIPAALVALIKNPPHSRSILFEVSATAETERSEALEALLGNAVDPREKVEDVGLVPAVLSRAQQAALGSAAHHPVTVIFGPPGTGKSYTMAAIAMDHVRRGESVLVATRGQTALDVLADKLETLIGTRDFVMRSGAGEHLKRMKRFVEAILANRLPFMDVEDVDPDEQEDALRGERKRVKKLEGLLDTLTSVEMAWGQNEVLASNGWLSGMSRSIKLDYYRWRILRHPAIWKLMEAYESGLTRRSETLSRLLRSRIRQHLSSAIRTHRKDLQQLDRAIRARTSANQEKYFDGVDFEAVLKTLPLWMVDASSVYRILPLEKELFDVALIDEATHCDPASCLPIIQRARRVVVTGDPRQLKHFSFLSRRQQGTIAQKHGLDEETASRFDYRERSLLDLAMDATSSHEQVVFLDEHFRSRPHIINFSNHHFYNDELKVMTWRPGQNAEPCLFVEHTGGQRLANGTNPKEAERVIEAAVQWIHDEARRQSDIKRTLGIISPLRDQVEHLQKALAQRIEPSAMQAHDVLIATPYGFQGQERDEIFISFAVDAQSNAASLRYLNRPDVFNVAITRARDRQVLFTSVQPNELPSDHLLRAYLTDAHIAPLSPEESRVDGDAFLNEVCQALKEKGFETWPAFPLAGMTIDLVVVKNTRAMGIDLVGHPGPYGDAYPLERTRMLHRAGLSIFTLPFSRWRMDSTVCVDAIEQRWSQSGSARSSLN